MAWTYNQASGVLSHDGEVIATGYSGHGLGENNPSLQDEPMVGPIPQGRYQIGPSFDSETHGPMVMRLTPEPDTNTFGRGGFLIHGDSILKPGSASLGCVIMPRLVRVEISASDDKVLEVV